MAIAGALGAQAERTGATVVAEGIETPEQVRYARALGTPVTLARRGGRAAEVEALAQRRPKLPLLTTALPHPWQAPFDLASARRPVRRGTMPLLASIIHERPPVRRAV